MAILKEPTLDMEKKQVQFTSLVDLLRANYYSLSYAILENQQLCMTIIHWKNRIK